MNKLRTYIIIVNISEPEELQPLENEFFAAHRWCKIESIDRVYSGDSIISIITYHLCTPEVFKSILLEKDKQSEIDREYIRNLYKYNLSNIINIEYAIKTQDNDADGRLNNWENEKRKITSIYMDPYTEINMKIFNNLLNMEIENDIKNNKIIPAKEIIDAYAAMYLIGIVAWDFFN